MKLIPRAFGKSGIEVSPLIFGSMRLNPAQMPLDEAVKLLSFLSDAGVTSWHSSHEYPTHAFFCEAARAAKLKSPVHVIKLGEPHFDVPHFRRERFIEIVEQELRALGTERIGIVQWVLRATPNIDSVRLPLLRECIAEVEETVRMLKSQGKIGAMAAFPYTPAVAELCLPRKECSGLASYLNFAERECVPFMEKMEKREQGYLAIRPLYAGKLLDGTVPEGKTFHRFCESQHIPPHERVAFALRWPLYHPVVSGIVLGMSSMAHAKQAVEAVADVQPDMHVFTRSARFFDEAF